MKVLLRFLLLLFCIASFSSCAAETMGTRQVDKQTFNWKFSLSDSPQAAEPDFDDSNWETIQVPHDWSILGPYDENNPAGGRGGWLPTGIGWYRKNIQIDKINPDKQYLIVFDGVFMNSQIWVNGQKAGGRPYGYVSFYFDITEALKSGRNTLAVRVDNEKAPNVRWYPGCGVYGDVTLIVKDKVNFDQWGIFVTTPQVDSDHAAVAVEAAINNGSRKGQNAIIESTILNMQGKPVASFAQKLNMPAGKQVFAKVDLQVDKPSLWSTESPYLYTLITNIKIDGKIVDSAETKFGIRSLKFDSQKGFFLNGKSTKLKGVCEHSDGGLVGSAIPEKVLRRRLQILKDMGCNAIRTAHNPRRPIFYDLCDEMGIMVMDEIFDGWHGKARHSYGAYYFKDWWKIDVRDWVKRDRNHPCVIMYSIGNETGITDKHNISGEIKKYDKTRPTTGGSLFYGVDVAGFNAPGGTPGVLENFHKNKPEKPVVLGEVPHTLQTRGFYRTLTWWRNASIAKNPFPDYNDKQIFFDGHLRYSSSYDNCGVRITARTCWKRTKETTWIMGEFRWTGFDYLGEASFGGGKWPARIWNFGIIDLCGFPKDHYYFYQSQWTDEPMVHVLPHWTHPGMEGVVIPVVAYSNCDEVELFLNDKSLDRIEPSELLEFVWRVPYQPGTLKAVGYRNNKAVATKIFKTASNPTEIELTADNQNIKADRFDISHLTTTIKDASGNFVPWANNRIDYKIDGSVKLLGFDNGDPVDVTTHRQNYRKTFNGLSLGIFQSTAENGPIEITAAGILGRTLFPEATTIAIDINRTALRGTLSSADFDITCSINNSKPVKYSGPFELTESATIKAVITKNNKSFMTIQSDFTKGPLPKITDPRLVTKQDGERESFDGPKDKEIVGQWTLKGKEGKAGRTFFFEPTGSVYTLNGTEKTLYGLWWYDYPDDVYEDPDDAGIGKMFQFVVDVTWTLKLTSQEAKQLNLKSRRRELTLDRKGPVMKR